MKNQQEEQLYVTLCTKVTISHHKPSVKRSQYCYLYHGAKIMFT